MLTKLRDGMELFLHYCKMRRIYLLKLFRSSLALGYIPDEWKRAKVIFIPKMGKADVAHPKSFIPICLTSFMLKTMEKTIDNYLRTTVMKAIPLHNDQYAYTAGHSTETALYGLTSKIEKSLEQKEIALLIIALYNSLLNH